MDEPHIKFTGFYSIGKPTAISPYCDVNWGSHGCWLLRGHDGHCECNCCACPNGQHDPEWTDEYGACCVAKSPYYGPETTFYGEDVEARGLPHRD